MSLFLLGFLFVIVIPLAEGVLFALLLREIHIRHPLPLGGVIETSERRRIREAKHALEEAKAKEKAIQSMSVPVIPQEEIVNDIPASDPVTAAAVDEEVQVPIPTAIDVFEEAGYIPDNVPINEVLDSMTTESPGEIPNDFEHQIEASARSDSDLPSAVRDISDEMNADDLNALAAALPRDKIDFSHELDSGIDSSAPISPMAKELLGEHFDFDALESQSIKMAARFTESANLIAELPDALLHVQEDEAGTVQVFSPIMSDTLMQYADLTMAETISPTFSADWIQEAAGIAATMEGESTKFCFTEEMPPMFVRKKKSS